MEVSFADIQGSFMDIQDSSADKYSWVQMYVCIYMNLYVCTQYVYTHNMYIYNIYIYAEDCHRSIGADVQLCRSLLNIYRALLWIHGALFWTSIFGYIYTHINIHILKHMYIYLHICMCVYFTDDRHRSIRAAVQLCCSCLQQVKIL